MNSNSSNTSLFAFALFGIQLPSRREQQTRMNVTLRTKFEHSLGSTVVDFVNSVQIFRAIT